MASREELLALARQDIPEMTVRQVHDDLQQGANPILLDVRELDEWERGRLKEAVHIPRGRLEMDAQARLPDRSRRTIVYCAAGVRSLLAGKTLKALGYRRVVSMSGGFGDWVDAGLPAEQPPPPVEDEIPEDPSLLAAEIDHLERVLARKKRLADLVGQKGRTNKGLVEQP